MGSLFSGMKGFEMETDISDLPTMKKDKNARKVSTTFSPQVWSALKEVESKTGMKKTDLVRMCVVSSLKNGM